MIVEIITHLNKAAYLVLNGAEIICFEGKYWNACKVRLKTESELYKNAKKGIVNYQNYMKVRSKIKLKMMKAYGVKPSPYRVK